MIPLGPDPFGIIFEKEYQRGQAPMVSFLEFGFEESACIGCGAGGDVFVGDADHQMTSALAALGTQVYYVVGTFDYIHVVLYDDYGVTAAYKGVE